MINQLSDKCREHLNRLIEAGAIRVVDGKYYSHSLSDPYGETPMTIVEIAEYAAFNLAATMYKEKYSDK